MDTLGCATLIFGQKNAGMSAPSDADMYDKMLDEEVGSSPAWGWGLSGNGILTHNGSMNNYTVSVGRLIAEYKEARCWAAGHPYDSRAQDRVKAFRGSLQKTLGDALPRIVGSSPAADVAGAIASLERRNEKMRKHIQVLAARRSQGKSAGAVSGVSYVPVLSRILHLSQRIQMNEIDIQDLRRQQASGSSPAGTVSEKMGAEELHHFVGHNVKEEYRSEIEEFFRPHFRSEKILRIIGTGLLLSGLAAELLLPEAMTLVHFGIIGVLAAFFLYRGWLWSLERAIGRFLDANAQTSWFTWPAEGKKKFIKSLYFLGFWTYSRKGHKEFIENLFLTVDLGESLKMAQERQVLPSMRNNGLEGLFLPKMCLVYDPSSPFSVRYRGDTMIANVFYFKEEHADKCFNALRTNFVYRMLVKQQNEDPAAVSKKLAPAGEVVEDAYFRLRAFDEEILREADKLKIRTRRGKLVALKVALQLAYNHTLQDAAVHRDIARATLTLSGRPSADVVLEIAEVFAMAEAIDYEERGDLDKLFDLVDPVDYDYFFLLRDEFKALIFSIEVKNDVRVHWMTQEQFNVRFHAIAGHSHYFSRTGDFYIVKTGDPAEDEARIAEGLMVKRYHDTLKNTPRAVREIAHVFRQEPAVAAALEDLMDFLGSTTPADRVADILWGDNGRFNNEVLQGEKEVMEFLDPTQLRNRIMEGFAALPNDRKMEYSLVFIARYVPGSLTMFDMFETTSPKNNNIQYTLRGGIVKMKDESMGLIFQGAPWTKDRLRFMQQEGRLFYDPDLDADHDFDKTTLNSQVQIGQRFLQAHLPFDAPVVLLATDESGNPFVEKGRDLADVARSGLYMESLYPHYQHPDYMPFSVAFALELLLGRYNNIRYKIGRSRTPTDREVLSLHAVESLGKLSTLLERFPLQGLEDVAKVRVVEDGTVASPSTGSGVSSPAGEKEADAPAVSPTHVYKHSVFCLVALPVLILAAGGAALLGASQWVTFPLGFLMTVCAAKLYVDRRLASVQAAIVSPAAAVTDISDVFEEETKAILEKHARIFSEKLEHIHSGADVPKAILASGLRAGKELAQDLGLHLRDETIGLQIVFSAFTRSARQPEDKRGKVYWLLVSIIESYSRTACGGDIVKKLRELNDQCRKIGDRRDAIRQRRRSKELLSGEDAQREEAALSHTGTRTQFFFNELTALGEFAMTTGLGVFFVDDGKPAEEKLKPIEEAAVFLRRARYHQKHGNVTSALAYVFKARNAYPHVRLGSWRLWAYLQAYYLRQVVRSLMPGDRVSHRHAKRPARKSDGDIVSSPARLSGEQAQGDRAKEIVGEWFSAPRERHFEDEYWLTKIRLYSEGRLFALWSESVIAAMAFVRKGPVRYPDHKARHVYIREALEVCERFIPNRGHLGAIMTAWNIREGLGDPDIAKRNRGRMVVQPAHAGARRFLTGMGFHPILFKTSQIDSDDLDVRVSFWTGETPDETSLLFYAIEPGPAKALLREYEDALPVDDLFSGDASSPAGILALGLGTMGLIAGGVVLGAAAIAYKVISDKKVPQGVMTKAQAKAAVLKNKKKSGHAKKAPPSSRVDLGKMPDKTSVLKAPETSEQEFQRLLNEAKQLLGGMKMEARDTLEDMLDEGPDVVTFTSYVGMWQHIAGQLNEKALRLKKLGSEAGARPHLEVWKKELQKWQPKNVRAAYEKKAAEKRGGASSPVSEEAARAVDQFNEDVAAMKDEIAEAELRNNLGWLGTFALEFCISVFPDHLAQRVVPRIIDEVQDDPARIEYHLVYDEETVRTLLTLHPPAKFKVVFDGWAKRNGNTPTTDRYVLEVLERSLCDKASMKGGEPVIVNRGRFISLDRNEALRTQVGVIGALVSTMAVFLSGISLWWLAPAVPLAFFCFVSVRKAAILLRDGKTLSVVEACQKVSARKMGRLTEASSPAGSDIYARRAREADFMRRLSVLAEANFAVNMGRALSFGADTMFEPLLAGPVAALAPRHADLVATLEFLNAFDLGDEDQLEFLIHNSERLLGRLRGIKAGQDAFGEWLVRKIVERLIYLADKFTSATYARMAAKYTQDHAARPEGEDLQNLERLMALMRQELSVPRGEKTRFLDVGTGLRDMTWLDEQKGLEVHGIDKSAPLMALISEKLGNRVDARPMDMNDLQYPDGMFHVVRSQASLHHFLLIDEEQGLDIVYREINRVLMTGGLFYIHTKAQDGDRRKGIQHIDTGEGFGGRVYQHANEKILREVLERNGFEPVAAFREWKDWRGDNNVIVTAKKVRTVWTSADKDAAPKAREAALGDGLPNAKKYWEWVHFRARWYQFYDYRSVLINDRVYKVGLFQHTLNVFDVHVAEGERAELDWVYKSTYKGCVNIRPGMEMHFGGNDRHRLAYPWMVDFALAWLREPDFIQRFAERNQMRIEVLAPSQFGQQDDRGSSPAVPVDEAVPAAERSSAKWNRSSQAEKVPGFRLSAYVAAVGLVLWFAERAGGVFLASSASAHGPPADTVVSPVLTLAELAGAAFLSIVFSAYLRHFRKQTMTEIFGLFVGLTAIAALVMQEWAALGAVTLPGLLFYVVTRHLDKRSEQGKRIGKQHVFDWDSAVIRPESRTSKADAVLEVQPSAEDETASGVSSPAVLGRDAALTKEVRRNRIATGGGSSPVVLKTLRRHRLFLQEEVEALAVQLDHPEDSERMRAARSLGEIAPEVFRLRGEGLYEAINALVRRLRHEKDIFVQVALVEALGAFGSFVALRKTGERSLVRFLGNRKSDIRVRRAVVRAMGAMKRTAVSDKLRSVGLRRLAKNFGLDAQMDVFIVAAFGNLILPGRIHPEGDAVMARAMFFLHRMVAGGHVQLPVEARSVRIVYQGMAGIEVQQEALRQVGNVLRREIGHIRFLMQTPATSEDYERVRLRMRQSYEALPLSLNYIEEVIKMPELTLAVVETARGVIGGLNDAWKDVLVHLPKRSALLMPTYDFSRLLPLVFDIDNVISRVAIARIVAERNSDDVGSLRDIWERLIHMEETTSLEILLGESLASVKRAQGLIDPEGFTKAMAGRADIAASRRLSGREDASGATASSPLLTDADLLEWCFIAGGVTEMQARVLLAHHGAFTMAPAMTHSEVARRGQIRDIAMAKIRFALKRIDMDFRVRPSEVVMQKMLFGYDFRAARQEIMDDVDAGMPLRDIAKKHHVSYDIVSLMVSYGSLLDLEPSVVSPQVVYGIRRMIEERGRSLREEQRIEDFNESVVAEAFGLKLSQVAALLKENSDLRGDFLALRTRVNEHNRKLAAGQLDVTRDRVLKLKMWQGLLYGLARLAANNKRYVPVSTTGLAQRFRLDVVSFEGVLRSDRELASAFGVLKKSVASHNRSRSTKAVSNLDLNIHSAMFSLGAGGRGFGVRRLGRACKLEEEQVLARLALVSELRAYGRQRGLKLSKELMPYIAGLNRGNSGRKLETFILGMRPWVTTPESAGRLFVRFDAGEDVFKFTQSDWAGYEPLIAFFESKRIFSDGAASSPADDSKQSEPKLPPQKGLARCYRVWRQFERRGDIGARKQRRLGVPLVRIHHTERLLTWMQQERLALYESFPSFYFMPNTPDHNPALAYNSGLALDWGVAYFINGKAALTTHFLFVLENLRVKALLYDANKRLRDGLEIDWLADEATSREDFLAWVRRMKEGILLTEIIASSGSSPAGMAEDVRGIGPKSVFMRDRIFRPEVAARTEAALNHTGTAARPWGELNIRIFQEAGFDYDLRYAEHLAFLKAEDIRLVFMEGAWPHGPPEMLWLENAQSFVIAAVYKGKIFIPFRLVRFLSVLYASSLLTIKPISFTRLSPLAGNSLRSRAPDMM